MAGLVVLFICGVLLGLLVSWIIQRFISKPKAGPLPVSQDPGAEFQKRIALEPPEAILSEEETDVEYKFVMGVRMDLKLGNLETARACAQLVVKAFVSGLPKHRDIISRWFYFSQAKICTKVPSREAMEQVIALADQSAVPYVTVERSGEVVAIGVGPGTVDAVNKVTGHLKLR